MLTFIKNKAKHSRKKTFDSAKMLRIMRKKTAGMYEHPETHWFILKIVTMICVCGVAVAAYLFHQRINQEAFESSSDVEAVGVEDIATGALLDVLVEERQRAMVFEELLNQGPLSYDPAFYGVELQPAQPKEDSSTSTNAGDTAIE